MIFLGKDDSCDRTLVIYLHCIIHLYCNTTQEKTLYTEEEFFNWCRDGDLLTYYSGEFDILVVNRTTSIPLASDLHIHLAQGEEDFNMEVVAVIRSASELDM